MLSGASTILGKAFKNSSVNKIEDIENTLEIDKYEKYRSLLAAICHGLLKADVEESLDLEQNPSKVTQLNHQSKHHANRLTLTITLNITIYFFLDLASLSWSLVFAETNNLQRKGKNARNINHSAIVLATSSTPF